MITRAEILMGRDAEYPLTPLLDLNLSRLHVALNVVRTAYGSRMIPTSGYRPGHFNRMAKGAAQSAHLTCEACDVADPTGELAKWCLANLAMLEQAGLWIEDPAHTKGWVHFQTRPVSVRVFQP
jgi:hypothetical protein